MQNYHILWGQPTSRGCNLETRKKMKKTFQENSTKRRRIMINILKKQNGMSIVGQGGKIILFMLPPLIAAILVHTYLPQIAALPESISFIKPVGYLLLLLGLILWGAAVIRRIRRCPQSHLLQCDVLHPSRRRADDVNLGLFCCFGLFVCRCYDFHRQRGEATHEGLWQGV
jgi:hypothetical protein